MPGEQYSERELNDHLSQWLAGFACPIGMDHVTVRRHLVDHGFILRDPSGTVYRTNGTVTLSVLEPDALSIQPRRVFEKVQRERQERKRAHFT